jgi:hypothetical protein
MARLSHVLMALMLLIGVPPAPSARAQMATHEQTATPPAPVNATAPDVLPGLPRPPDSPESLFHQPPAGPAYSCAPLPGPYFEQDPLLDVPNLPQPGWVATVDLEAVGPHVKNGLADSVHIDGRPTDIVRLPAADLDWTVAPRFELGYRLPSGFGQFSFAYRSFGTDGTGTATGPDTLESLRSRLSVNVVDMDYANNEFTFFPSWGMKWWFGLRFADAYFDSLAQEPFAAAAAGSGIFETRTSNNFWGLGPHMGLELSRRLGVSGLSLVGWADGATLLGRIRQNFFEELTATGANGLPLTGNTRESVSQDVPILAAFIGLAWQPPRYPQLRLSAGYAYEYWWNVGRNSGTFSRAELSDQGILFRAEFNY